MRRLPEMQGSGTKAQLAALLDSIPDAIVITDQNHRISSCNPAFAALFGYRPEEVIGKPEAVLFARSSEAAPASGRPLAPTTLAGKTPAHEVLYRKRDGETFPAATIHKQFDDGHGNPLGFLWIIRDLSERRRAQHALQESEARYRALASARENLLAVVSHDLKNPLSSV